MEKKIKILLGIVLILALVVNGGIFYYLYSEQKMEKIVVEENHTSPVKAKENEKVVKSSNEQDSIVIEVDNGMVVKPSTSVTRPNDQTNTNTTTPSNQTNSNTNLNTNSNTNTNASTNKNTNTNTNTNTTNTNGNINTNTNVNVSTNTNKNTNTNTNAVLMSSSMSNSNTNSHIVETKQTSEDKKADDESLEAYENKESRIAIIGIIVTSILILLVDIFWKKKIRVYYTEDTQ